ncbi:hypothetical protein Adt_06082 [Abeliophyllum distichum]|uniref:Uncharacterized protein n=1 Tax=Abeliophyllum distichum TaxID=126358 RepID=A0ABD1V6C1_9LAMI
MRRSKQPYLYSMCVPYDAVDVRVDTIVHEFVYGGQEDGGGEEDDGEEQGGQEFGGGEEDDGEEQGGQEFGGGEKDNGEEQGGQQYGGGEEDTEMLVITIVEYDDDYYATNEHLNTLLAEQRSYFDDQLAEQRCYFDDQISGVRDEVLQQFQHLESLVSNSSRETGHQYQEMQRFIENMQREIQTSVAQMHGKFEEVMVVRPTAGSGGGGGGTVGGVGGGTVGGGDANPVVVDRGKKTLGSSSISVDIPILCDVNKRKESQFLDWLMRSKPTDFVRFAGGAKWTKENLQQIGNVEFSLEPKDMDNAMLLIRVRNAKYLDIFSEK